MIFKIAVITYGKPTDIDALIINELAYEKLGWKSIDGKWVGLFLKEIGTFHWTSPNTGVTNESGYTVLPGCFRNGNGIFPKQKKLLIFMRSFLLQPDNRLFYYDRDFTSLNNLHSV
jgi:hypothetical protein